MRLKFTAISLITLLSLSGCYIQDEDLDGPRGPQGPQGEPGESGYVFEFENVDFTAPDYDVILSYPSDFEPLNSDVAVTYLLWDIQEIDGEDVEIWRAIPQTVLTEHGTLQYNYDFTKYDVRLFLEADFELNLLTAIDTDEWVVRIVVIPGEFWNSGSRLSFSDYYDVKELMGLPDMSKPRKLLKRR